MIEKSTMCGHRLPQEPESTKNPITSIFKSEELAFLCDAQRGQPKPGGRNAGHHRSLLRGYICPISHQPSFRTRLIPEVLKISSFQIFQKRIVVRRKTNWRR